MAISLMKIRARVQSRLRDLVAKGSAFDQVEYDQAICDAYLFVHARLPAASVLQQSALTIAAGGDTFSLPTTAAQWTGGDSGAEYAGEVAIQLRSNRLFLNRRSRREIDAMRNLHPITYLGIPYWFCLWEEKDQTVQGRVYPGALAAEVCDIFVTLAATDLRDFVGAAGTSTLEDVKLQLSLEGATALVYEAAAEMAEAMDRQDAKRKRINPAVAAGWRKRALILLYQEAARHAAVQDTGRTQRWVS